MATKYAVSPTNAYSGDIKKGKKYEIRGLTEGSFWITDDSGAALYCRCEGCGHIKGLTWKIQEDDNEG